MDDDFADLGVRCGRPGRPHAPRLAPVRGRSARAGEQGPGCGRCGGTAAFGEFHLDKLVAHGLLDTEFRRLTGRQGPGAGRPTKLYRRSRRPLSVMCSNAATTLPGVCWPAPSTTPS